MANGLDAFMACPAKMLFEPPSSYRPYEFFILCGLILIKLSFPFQLPSSVIDGRFLCTGRGATSDCRSPAIKRELFSSVHASQNNRATAGALREIPPGALRE